MSMRKNIRKIIDNFFPISLSRFIYFLWGCFFKYHKSYSQKGEDLIILSYFNGLNIKNGVYLDIGCFHPVWISNTHLLHKNNWTGYAVDIDKHKLKAMSFIRGKNVKCFMGAVSPKANQNENAKIYKFNRPWSDLDSLDKSFAESIKKELNLNYIEENIQLIDINDLFSKLPHINLLNLDIEGIDTDVVLSLDFEKYKPDLIVLEDNKWGGNKKLHQKMEKYEYKLIFVSGNSIGFARETKKNNLLMEFRLKY